jgi:hypothetical protein
MSNIKVGDRVVLLGWEGFLNNLSLTSGMREFVGQTVTVIRVDKGDLRSRECGYWWPLEAAQIARSTPAERLAKVERMVGRAVGRAQDIFPAGNYLARLDLLSRRMRRAQRAASLLESLS